MNSLFELDNFSRKNTVKILIIGNYLVLLIDILQNFAFLPLYLHFIGSRLYGLWLGTGGLLAVLSFFDMGVASLTVQRVSREFSLKNYVGVSKYFFGGILINSVFLFLLFLCGFILSFFLKDIFIDISFKEKELLSEAFLIAMGALVLSLLNNTIEGTLNALQKSLIGKISQLLASITGISIVYLLLIGDNPLLAIPIGLLVKSLLALIPNVIYLSLLFVKNNMNIICINRDAINEYLRLSPNLMLSKVGSSIVGNIEPTLINIFISPEIAVYYNITKKGGEVIRILLDRIGGVIFPSMSHLFASENIIKFKNRFIDLLNYVIPICITFFGLFIVFNRFMITLWVGVDNYMGNLITILIALSMLLGFLSNLLSYLLVATGDIKFSSNMVFFESILKSALMLSFLYLFGIHGIPISLIIISFLFCFFYMKRWNNLLDLSVKDLKRLLQIHYKYITIYSVILLSIYFLMNIYDFQPSLLLFMTICGITLIINIGLLFLTNDTYKNLIFYWLKQNGNLNV